MRLRGVSAGGDHRLPGLCGSFRFVSPRRITATGRSTFGNLVVVYGIGLPALSGNTLRFIKQLLERITPFGWVNFRPCRYTFGRRNDHTRRAPPALAYVAKLSWQL